MTGGLALVATDMITRSGRVVKAEDKDPRKDRYVKLFFGAMDPVGKYLLKHVLPPAYALWGYLGYKIKPVETVRAPEHSNLYSMRLLHRVAGLHMLPEYVRRHFEPMRLAFEQSIHGNVVDWRQYNPITNRLESLPSNCVVEYVERISGNFLDRLVPDVHGERIWSSSVGAYNLNVELLKDVLKHDALYRTLGMPMDDNLKQIHLVDIVNGFRESYSSNDCAFVWAMLQLAMKLVQTFNMDFYTYNVPFLCRWRKPASPYIIAMLDFLVSRPQYLNYIEMKISGHRYGNRNYMRLEVQLPRQGVYYTGVFNPLVRYYVQSRNVHAFGDSLNRHAKELCAPESMKKLMDM